MWGDGWAGRCLGVGSGEGRGFNCCMQIKDGHVRSHYLRLCPIIMGGGNGWRLDPEPPSLLLDTI